MFKKKPRYSASKEKKKKSGPRLRRPAKYRALYAPARNICFIF